MLVCGNTVVMPMSLSEYLLIDVTSVLPCELEVPPI
jgi:hypothetical protein